MEKFDCKSSENDMRTYPDRPEVVVLVTILAYNRCVDPIIVLISSSLQREFYWSTERKCHNQAQVWRLVGFFSSDDILYNCNSKVKIQL